MALILDTGKIYRLVRIMYPHEILTDWARHNFQGTICDPIESSAPVDCTSASRFELFGSTEPVILTNVRLKYRHRITWYVSIFDGCYSLFVIVVRLDRQYDDAQESPSHDFHTNLIFVAASFRQPALVASFELAMHWLAE